MTLSAKLVSILKNKWGLHIITFSCIFSTICLLFSSVWRFFSSSLSPIIFPKSIILACLLLFFGLSSSGGSNVGWSSRRNCLHAALAIAIFGFTGQQQRCLQLSIHATMRMIRRSRSNHSAIGSGRLGEGFLHWLFDMYYILCFVNFVIKTVFSFVTTIKLWFVFRILRHRKLRPCHFSVFIVDPHKWCDFSWYPIILFSQHPWDAYGFTIREHKTVSNCSLQSNIAIKLDKLLKAQDTT